MLHIMLTILKFLGVLILGILGLIVLLLLSILLIPVSYRLKGRKMDGTSPEAEGVVTWLFGLIWVKIKYSDHTTDTEIRILGVPLRSVLTFIRKIKKTREQKRKPRRHISSSKDAKRIPEEKHPETMIEEEESCHNEFREEKETVEPETNSFMTKLFSVLHPVRALLGKIIGLPSRIKKALGKMKLTFESLCDKIRYWKDFLSEDVTREAILCIKNVSWRLLRHILPKKLSGYLKFGFDDPSVTGQLLGVLSLVTPIYRSRFQIIPVFEEKTLECDVYLKGRVFGFVLLKIAIDVYRNHAVRTAIKKFQHKEA